MKTKTLILIVPILAVMLTVLAVALSLTLTVDTAYASDGFAATTSVALEIPKIVGIAIGAALAGGLIIVGVVSGAKSAQKSKKEKEAAKKAAEEEERKKQEQAAAKKAAQEKKEAQKKAAEEKKKEEARRKAEQRKAEEEARKAAIEEMAAVANEPEVVEEPKEEEKPVEETKEEPVYEGEDVVPEEEKADVDEIIKEASQVKVTKTIINKKFVYEHIENAEYASKAQVNKRPNYNSANFPVPDTHYACGDEDKCFIYVYETKNPTVLLIYNTPEYAAELKKEHEYVAESKVPRSNDTWFKLIMDDSYTEEQVGKIIDDCFEYAYRVTPIEEIEEPEEDVFEQPVEEEPTPVEEPVQEEVVEEAPAEEPVVEEEPEEEEVTLKESLAAAAKVVSSSSDKIDKKFVYEYLEHKYGSDVETNKRENYTSTGLPLADTHYALGAKKKCFVYVYETEGTTLLLINNTTAYEKELKKEHKLVTRSAFPKSKDYWFSLIIDDSYTAAQVCKILDDCYLLAGGKASEEEVAMTLKESLAAAAKVHAEKIKIDKKCVAEYLEKKYGDKVEINTRENKTSTGLPLADTHYAVEGKKKKCLIYVYETDTSTLLLINNTSAYEKELKKKHQYVSKSAFPKSKDEWFSVVIDDSFNKEDIDNILDNCYELALK